MKELKMTFSSKTKAADAKWRIETFKQGKKKTVDFIIEFEALAMKVDTDELHGIIKTILGYPPIAMLETLKE